MIYISPDFRIRPDQHCYVLESRSDSKTAKGEHKDSWAVTYHPTYQQIAKKIIETSLNKQDIWASCDDLNQLSETMERLAKTLGEQIVKVGA